MSLSSNCMLPLEIWETIITMLVPYPRSMVSASNVCQQWRHLAMRICENYCKNNLNQRLLIELQETIVTHQYCKPLKENDWNYNTSEGWIGIYWLYHETILDTSHLADDVYSFDSAVCITSADPYLLVSSYAKEEDKTEVTGFCSFASSLDKDSTRRNGGPSCSHGLRPSFALNVPGNILNITVLSLPRPVLLMSTTSHLMAGLVPVAEEEGAGGGVVLTNPRLKGHSKTSGEGNRFLVPDPKNGSVLLLFEVPFVSLSVSPFEADLDVVLMGRVQTRFACYSWILARGMIKTMETSGHIRIYKMHQSLVTKTPTKVHQQEEKKDKEKEEQDEEKEKKGKKVRKAEENEERKEKEKEDGKEEEEEKPLSMSLAAESELSKDLRYPNPTLFTKDLVFSSTLVSRDLLEYWHMSRDREYWILAETSTTFLNDMERTEGGAGSPTPPSCIPLHRVRLGSAVGQEVTAVHSGRDVLLCGTSEGHVFGYRLPPRTEDSSDELSGPPWIYLRAKTPRFVSRLGSLFTQRGLVVAVGESGGRCSLLFVPVKREG